MRWKYFIRIKLLSLVAAFGAIEARGDIQFDFSNYDPGVVGPDVFGSVALTTATLTDPNGATLLNTSSQITAPRPAVFFEDSTGGASSYLFDLGAGIDFTADIGQSLVFTLIVRQPGNGASTASWLGSTFLSGGDIRLIGNNGAITLAVPDAQDPFPYNTSTRPAGLNVIGNTVSYDIAVPLTAANFGTTAPTFASLMADLESIRIRAEFFSGSPIGNSAQESALVGVPEPKAILLLATLLLLTATRRL